MRIRIALPILLLLLCRSTAVAQQGQPPAEFWSTAREVLKDHKPSDGVRIGNWFFQNDAKGTGIDVKAAGSAATTVDLKNSTPPGAHLGNGTGSQGGGGDVEASAAQMSSSMTWRWVIGAIGLGLIGFGIYEFLKKPLPDVREGSIAAGSGIVLIVGAAFFPTLLIYFMLGALLLIISKSLLSAQTKAKIDAAGKAVQGSLDTAVTAINSAGAPALAAWHAEVAKIVEPAEVPIINASAVANDARLVKV